MIIIVNLNFIPIVIFTKIIDHELIMKYLFMIINLDLMLISFTIVPAFNHDLILILSFIIFISRIYFILVEDLIINFKFIVLTMI